MMEHVGYAAMTETPCVFVNVQRGGPSTGLPTLPAQADMMQARWGSHGDYGIIALCPNSPQECFDLTITGFNLAEEFRVPVMMMLDEYVGHMTEKVEVTPRRFTTLSPAQYRPAEPAPDMVPDMVKAGDGYHFHVTGMTHDERGYPNIGIDVHDRLVRRLLDKLKPLENGRGLCETEDLEGAEVVVASYGITSRVAQHAVLAARKRGIHVGTFRLITAWPFPTQRIRQIAENVKAFVVPELNLGQMVREVERATAGRARVIPVSHAGGSVHKPQAILEAIMESAL
jgi:2-oxoglutarate ferredoxin oxidoreductase subunit alpha